ncbi:MAG: thioether cross-link-forming SCIFF peptide maturase [Firmicutes bacterium]|nr:thioether cross-link-forming SCIFF peptide maturase [Bacillota bacterium]
MKKGQIHMFNIDGIELVLDVESDTLHRVDAVAADVIALLDEGVTAENVRNTLKNKYPPREIAAAIEETELLQREGLLWAEPVHLKAKKGRSPVKALCLNVAHSCNLSCRYCFAGEGKYGEKNSLMSVDTGKAAIDFLLEQSDGKKHMEIDYFGGEPLLNMNTVKGVTAYARQRGEQEGVEFHFTITTNALLLNDDSISYFKDNDFSTILSLDGRPEVHNRMRRTAGGKETYGIIAGKILDFLERCNGNYYVRGTFTRFNRDFSRDVVHLYELGIRNISLEPVVSPPADEWSLRDEDRSELEREYELLAAFYLHCLEKGDPFKYFHFNVDLENGPCIYRRLSGCGAGEEYLAVTPSGELYPCHQLIGNRKLMMGNVKRKDFKLLDPEVFPITGPLRHECASCWARYHCGGGCRAASKLIHDEFERPYLLECALQKKRLECALYLKAMELSMAKQVENTEKPE